VVASDNERKVRPPNAFAIRITAESSFPSSYSITAKAVKMINRIMVHVMKTFFIFEPSQEKTTVSLWHRFAQKIIKREYIVIMKPKPYQYKSLSIIRFIFTCASMRLHLIIRVVHSNVAKI